ncbi:MAG: hypothetical protein ABFQ95_01125 [Pseudomonadota bacterium]
MAKLIDHEAARTFAATSLTGSYQDVGAILTKPALGFVIYNTSDVDVQISFDDGAKNGPIIPSGGTFDSNRISQRDSQEEGMFALPESAQVQVKQVTGAGASGNIILNVVS